MICKVLLLSLVIASALAYTREGARVVENGSEIFRDGSSVTIKEPSGNFTVVDISGNSHNKRDSGWIASVWTFFNYSYYTAQWKVPTTPTTNNGQILFYFNSFENTAYNDILQPVLQFNNIIGGWSLASWYGAAGNYFHSDPAPVSVGDTITGVVQLNGNTWNVLGYVNGAQKSSISVSYATVSAQGNAQFAMEVYNIDTCSMYPPSNRIDVSGISLRAGQTEVSPKFQTSINSNSCNAGASYTTTTATLTWNS